jgi:hypothetical protein
MEALHPAKEMLKGQHEKSHCLTWVKLKNKTLLRNSPSILMTGYEILNLNLILGKPK